MRMKIIYCKIPVITPGPIFVQKSFFGGLIFGGAYFRRGFNVIIKTAENTKITA